MHSLYNQVRVAAAIAKGQLTAAAAKALATPAQGLKIKHGIIRAPAGRATNYGSLTRKAAITPDWSARSTASAWLEQS